ncbi:unnamed protein product [Cylicocyclus nassatus]|uniref:Uncharacterized protein n=1 Tax=Cylicocyclus nassatus TaxID=53992 RepID=A0AA36H1E3_CYLNA|nr:unnamed protein product [Cylicocyclus nassatus]
MLHFIVETVTFLVATCLAVLQCPDGAIEVESATEIIEYVNQVREKLANGLQTTADGAFLPPPKDMTDLVSCQDARVSALYLYSKKIRFPNGFMLTHRGLVALVIGTSHALDT